MEARQNPKNLVSAVFSLGLSFMPAGGWAASGPLDDMDSYLRVIWGLLVVLGIILLLYALLKKKFSLLSNSAQQQIKILEIKPLMGRKALCLVEVRGQEYLLGISGDRIDPIAAIPKTSESAFAGILKSSVEGSQP